MKKFTKSAEKPGQSEKQQLPLRMHKAEFLQIFYFQCQGTWYSSRYARRMFSEEYNDTPELRAALKRVRFSMMQRLLTRQQMLVLLDYGCIELSDFLEQLAYMQESGLL